MTENQIKEQLSRVFIGLIGARCGHKIDGLTIDHGTDIRIEGVVQRTTPNGRVRFIDSGVIISAQIKATTEKKVKRTNGVIKYQLEGKTYNDLVFRKRNSQTPLLLLLFILPDDEEEWVECHIDKLIARQHIYWYDIHDDALSVDNEESRKTIEIPERNLINIQNFPNLIKQNPYYLTPRV